MNFWQTTENRKRALVLVALAPVWSGCDSASTTQQEKPECTVTLTRSETQPLSVNETEIIFKGELSDSCVQETSQRTGTTQVKLSTHSSEANESVALKQLKAGSRTIEFDPESDNLKRGSFETSFDSSLLPEWSVPWRDKPGLISVSMIAGTSANPDSIPATVTVELSF